MTALFADTTMIFRWHDGQLDMSVGWFVGIVVALAVLIGVWRGSDWL